MMVKNVLKEEKFEASIPNWVPPSTFEEQFKNTLIPARLYYSFYAYWQLWRGEPELKLLPYLIDRKRNAVDAGANRGSYTYWLQRYSKHVYAYEPNPKIYRLLRVGARGNVTVRPIALSNETSSAKFRVPKRKKIIQTKGQASSTKALGQTMEVSPLKRAAWMMRIW